MSLLGLVTLSMLQARLWQHGIEEVQTNPNTWPWVALASIVLHELLAGKRRGVACMQMLCNRDLV